MTQDARPDRDDGEERAELRARLREWSVPEAPAGMEDALRREIRKRRSRPRAGLWLSLAACLALTAAWPLFAPRRGSGPAEVSTPSKAAIESSAPKLEPAARPSPPSRASRAAAGSRSPRPRPKPPAVVVEASQAELLAEFGRRAWETPQAAAATIPAWTGAEAPAYRGEWEEVAGEWPAVEIVAPMSRR